MEGIEPHWNKIRPMVLPFADIFNPPPPLKIDMDPNSKFYNELMEVYEVGKQVTEDNNDSEEAKIAASWDCNPYMSPIIKVMQCLLQKKYSWRSLDWNYQNCY